MALPLGSKRKPFVLDSEEEEDVANAKELNFLELPSDSNSDSDVEIVDIKPRDEESPKNNRAEDPRESDIALPWIESKTQRLTKDTNIKEGDVVEIGSDDNRKVDLLYGNDFLKIRKIYVNLEDDEVKLRGHRMKRTRNHGQILDWHFNELVMVVHVSETDSRSAFVQGLEDVSLDRVVQKRECVLTNKPYPMRNWKTAPIPDDLHVKNRKEVTEWIYTEARLVCRWIHIITMQENGRSYGGIIRGLYSQETDEHYRQDNALPRLQRSDSIEKFDGVSERRPKLPEKPTQYTFGDVFCGAGGASAGAGKAGLYVKWGLDSDEHAMNAYSSNFPDAYALHMDAHAFPDPADIQGLLQVNVLHLSPPCTYWSPAHTREGPNDQDNFEAIYTVGPILEKIKPRVATLEQTSGLVTSTAHNKIFKLLLNDIIKARYNVRYKIQDLSEFGVPQRRKRLLIIAARRGTPLPAFPVPTHGDPGSGLKRFVSIYDAVLPLQGFSEGVPHDEYHQPGQLKSIDKDPYDPKTSMLGCITTGGAEKGHFSGRRHYTARELSLLQTFSINHAFTGSQTEAKKQIGNAFPPVMAEAMLRTIAQTLEAYDHGLIGAEEEIQDLQHLLRENGVQLPERVAASSFRSSSIRSPYRYLVKEDPTSRSGPSTPTKTKKRPLFAHGNYIEPEEEKAKKKRIYYGLVDDEDSDDNEIQFLSSARRRIRRTRMQSDDEKLRAAAENGEIWTISD